MAITNIVLEVELVKQCQPPVTDQQRLALVRMLDGTGKSLDEIAEMGKKVVAMNTFGRTAFEYWVDEGKVEKITVKSECSFCMSEWWGPPDMKCPKCFPKDERKSVPQLQIECAACGRTHGINQKCEVSV